MYVGVFTTDHSEDLISAACAAAVKQVVDKGVQDEELLADLKAITQKSDSWKVVKDPHITTLFMGKKLPKEDHKKKLYQSFAVDQAVPITVHAVAYVPKGLIVAVTHLDRSKVQVDNPHDHITLMLSSFSAKQSNDVLNEIFSNSKLLASKQSQFADLASQEVVKCGVSVGKKKHDAYLIKLSTPVEWSGKTRKMY